MTTGAGRLPVFRIELTSMRILVAVLACFRRASEPNLGLTRVRSVAGTARYASMCSAQRESRLGMIEPINVNPRTGAVAGLAAERRSVRPAPLHAAFELAAMRINVTGGTGTIGKMERQNLVLPPRCAWFVTIGARNRQVATGEHER